MSLEHISSWFFSKTMTKIPGCIMAVGSECTAGIIGLFLSSVTTLSLGDRVQFPPTPPSKCWNAAGPPAPKQSTPQDSVFNRQKLTWCFTAPSGGWRCGFLDSGESRWKGDKAGT